MDWWSGRGGESQSGRVRGVRDLEVDTHFTWQARRCDVIDQAGFVASSLV